ncbi:MAG: hypothetical protein K6E50_08560 [Lachnospiraceae bacterium]|nr:hypothetical protein [Lachnospiraceae bacterium]
MEERFEEEELEMLDLRSEHRRAEEEGRDDARKAEVRRLRDRGKSRSGLVGWALAVFFMLVAAGLGVMLIYSRSSIPTQSQESGAETQAPVAASQPPKEKPADGPEADGSVTGSEQVLEQDPAFAGAQPDAALPEEKLYTQEEVDAMVAALVEERVDECLDERVAEELQGSLDAQKAELKRIVTEAALKENGGPMTAVRALFEDQVFYTVEKDTYEFAPILEGVPRNDVVEENLQKDDDGRIRYMVNGQDVAVPMIDVSQYQGAIDWNAVAGSGIKFAMIRAAFRGYGSGKLVPDETFIANVKGATAAGVKIGAYVFSEAITEDEAREEAHAAMDQLAGYKVDLPIVLDMEHIGYDDARQDQLSKADRTKVALAFLNEVEKGGYKPMLYTGLLVYFHYLEQEKMNRYPLWYAFYSDTFYFPYKVACWQYRSNARVPGISGDVDMSIWFVDPMSL